MDTGKVKVLDWEIEFYDILSNVIQIHIRKGLTEKEAMWFKTQGAKVRRIEGTEREIENEQKHDSKLNSNWNLADRDCGNYCCVHDNQLVIFRRNCCDA